MSSLLDDPSGMAELARECVYLTLRQSSKRATTKDLLSKFNLTPAEFMDVFNDTQFKRAMKIEMEHARSLGHRAGYIYRVESMLDDIAELIFARLHEEGVSITDLIKGFAALARSAGLEITQPEPVNSQVNMAVQINVPRLDNDKLEYLRTKE
jgi:hypothetical protein